MEEIGRYIESQKRKINQGIEKYLSQFFSSSRKHEQAALYTIYPEGHRYRSVLALEVYEMLGGRQDNFLRGVVGLECIHHASLIFDDLPCMDNAEQRKAKPATWVQYGQDVAILAAVALENEGRYLIAENAREHRQERDVEKLLYETLRDLYVGQEIDLQEEKTDAALWESMRKKNKLMEVAFQLPAVLLRGDQGEKALLRAVGEDIAVAYQLFDDLRDVSAPEITGKPVGLDVERQTSVYRWGIDCVREEVMRRKQRTLQNIRSIREGTQLERMIEYMITTPS
ncbi:polyprenyl synthetase family protein [Candidatus Woesearchaeota archaeon]|nr:polyprenyl synthetase family protein [Candidatus Woesearchaeota archaeon]